MHHSPIAFVLAPKSLGSRISGGALATTARALRMMGHVTVKFRWTTPDKTLCNTENPICIKLNEVYILNMIYFHIFKPDISGKVTFYIQTTLVF